ncbi:penicillin-binding protein [Paenibacillus sp. GSMTC-2017]|uniref:peptidoglycan D,D-transpeptidase FtsI family protein n=1 Tax=Paenibacillus sp. GSMTC-2017 TaxID=2794350 RepID=UPI0018D6E8F9|nr:penicillin-binding transpeptidase domain-containing protein [Paenibacillus sp. GSMTC-2017]MBH5317073.1 penicillin-binding protein [Paenibacillus sp. GSMTC-2017]
MKRRAVIMGIIVSLIMFLFIGRLMWLQLLPGTATSTAPVTHARDNWKRLAVVQRQRSLVLDTGRGDFVDRYGRPMTGETYMTAALFPVRPTIRGSEEQLAALAKLFNVTYTELNNRWNAIREPEFWHEPKQNNPIRLTSSQVEKINGLKVEGIRVLPYRNRYLPGFDAKHIIGFTSQHPEWLKEKHKEKLTFGKRKISEQVGGSGLEKSLENLLHGIGETSVSYFIDGRNSPLHGLDLRIVQPKNNYYPLQVVTTIDLLLQNKIEHYADKQGLKEGAIVVLDSKNADIVAMVSRPKLKPGQFRSGDGSEWENHALKAVEPGSIFKLVTAASAIENGVVERHERFHCDGEYGKYGLSCWRDGGHGDISLQEGLAQSCNIVFATLAERLSGKQLQKTAKSLGVIGLIGWHSSKAYGPFPHPFRLLEEEEDGRVFSSELIDEEGEKIDGGAMAQSGIGQRDVRMSPLQAANLIVTLLNGGRVKEPRLVSEIRYANGQRMAVLKRRDAAVGSGRIKLATAKSLLRGMEAVVDHGTGRSIRQGQWAVAGKSGTAETVKAGVARNHQWFAGYGPVQAPRYAVAVLAANRSPGSSHQATKLFRGVMDIAAKHEAVKSKPAT